jgi:hypothetical protein
VFPLADWRTDADRLDELAFCKAHPYPLLVHHTAGYKLRPLVDRAAMTIDRAVLGSRGKPTVPSSIDEYLAVPVRPISHVQSFELAVGCGDVCDIHIDDVTVSNIHAFLMQDRRGNWYLRDAGSTTGTHVNDQDPQPTQVLVTGDRISFGMVDTVFYLPGPAYALIRRLI